MARSGAFFFFLFLLLHLGDDKEVPSPIEQEKATVQDREDKERCTAKGRSAMYPFVCPVASRTHVRREGGKRAQMAEFGVCPLPDMGVAMGRGR